MKLLQHRFQLFRDRQSEVCGILRKAHALVGDVEEDHRRAQNAARADNLHIEDVGNHGAHAVAKQQTGGGEVVVLVAQHAAVVIELVVFGSQLHDITGHAGGFVFLRRRDDLIRQGREIPDEFDLGGMGEQVERFGGHLVE